MTDTDRAAAEHCPKCGRRGACIGGFGPVSIWVCPVCDAEIYPHDEDAL